MMKRLTAALLVLFALTGIVVPIAQAAALAPNHACCLRKAAHQHQCHGSGPSDELTLHGTSCCDHDCCRAVRISQLANPQAWVAAYVGESPILSVTFSHASASISDPTESRFTRGPPFSVIA
jgi:hypothetical protein